ncbi:CTC-interacting domain 9 [Hibiscus syriacus]|uniref:Polygalacturonase n=1 Tax=Hibiscus syriacus TaxID=106335 RepID=A0A6A3ATB2_HIBSY|nr:CTC-interacting domain 9 [Hibiscus syriacus]
MALQTVFAAILLPIFLSISSASAQSARTVNVRNYGVVADGGTDNEKGFLRAWNEACNGNGASILYVPKGEYVLGPVVFSGPCKGPIMFLMAGVLKALPGPSDVSIWINFRNVNLLLIKGGGTFDGQGPSAWRFNNCAKDPNCKPLPINLKFDSVTNSRIEFVKSVNSKQTHISFHGCENVNITNVEVLAPADSPNTDGIKMGRCSGIRILNSRISTGDDCVAILSGSSNIEVSNVRCGPGHGISIGSLGKYQGELNVHGVTVTNCTFSQTDNGVRIKSWASQVPATASNFLFQDIVMDRVLNPIIIDQTYCPHTTCDQEAASHIQISDVTYRNIRGTSSSEVAVSFQCSKKFPCKNIMMADVNFVNAKRGSPLKSTCSNVIGRSFGLQIVAIVVVVAATVDVIAIAIVIVAIVVVTTIAIVVDATVAIVAIVVDDTIVIVAIVIAATVVIVDVTTVAASDVFIAYNAPKYELVVWVNLRPLCQAN